MSILKITHILIHHITMEFNKKTGGGDILFTNYTMIYVSDNSKSIPRKNPKQFIFVYATLNTPVTIKCFHKKNKAYFQKWDISGNRFYLRDI